MNELGVPVVQVTAGVGVASLHREASSERVWLRVAGRGVADGFVPVRNAVVTVRGSDPEWAVVAGVLAAVPLSATVVLDTGVATPAIASRDGLWLAALRIDEGPRLRIRWLDVRGGVVERTDLPGLADAGDVAATAYGA